MAKNLIQAAYYQRNKEKLKEASRKRYAENKESHAANGKVWELANKEKRNAYFNEYFKERKKDPVFRAMHNARKRASAFLKGKQNGVSKKLGCDRATFRYHIEAKFTEGMTWDNYGDWEIDHKIPLSSVNSEEEIRILCHFSNLQPLWKADNIRKRNR